MNKNENVEACSKNKLLLRSEVWLQPPGGLVIRGAGYTCKVRVASLARLTRLMKHDPYRYRKKLMKKRTAEEQAMKRGYIAGAC